MKKFLSIILIGGLLCSMASCKKAPAPQPQAQPQQETAPTPDWMLPPEGEGYIDYKAEQEEISVNDALVLIEDPQADPKSAAYKNAVYTVKENFASEVIDNAHSTNTKTPEVEDLFKGIAFSFIEGDNFANAEIRNRVRKLGNFEKGADGIYTFTFHDRTLAQSAVNLNDPHALRAYTEVLDLLLSDTNVKVVVLK
jgi:hypothetical protein